MEVGEETCKKPLARALLQAVQKPKHPKKPHNLFKHAPDHVQRLSKQAHKELRLKARAKWWNENNPNE